MRKEKRSNGGLRADPQVRGTSCSRVRIFSEKHQRSFTRIKTTLLAMSEGREATSDAIPRVKVQNAGRNVDAWKCLKYIKEIASIRLGHRLDMWRAFG